MSSLLIPEFFFHLKSPSCNANAINALFTGKDTHTCTRRRNKKKFLPFITRCSHDGDTKMRGYGIRQNPNAHLSYSFFSRLYFSLGFSSYERQKGEKKKGTLAALHSVKLWLLVLHLLIPQAHTLIIHTHTCTC